VKAAFRSIGQRFLGCSKAAQGISVICAYNNREKLDKYLISSLNRQDGSFELLAIDNTQGRYPSAAAILNETAKKARYDYFMFVHQDVALIADTWLTDAQTALGQLRNLGAAGVAGNGRRGGVRRVLHGNPPFRAIRKKLRKPMPVQTLDGCLMIVPREVFQKIAFDEKAVNGWYLYTANYCLDLIRAGYRIYVLPRPIYHESTGPSDPNSYEGARQDLIERHRDHLQVIYTTMGTWKT
jgi:GT2 family glycosyltransferase